VKRSRLKEILERRRRRGLDLAGKVLVGKVVGAYSVKGEVKVKPESDVFERQMKALRAVPLYKGVRKELLTVESMRPYKGVYIVKFKEVLDRTGALALVGAEIWIDRHQQVELDEDEFYLSDLLGCKVVTTDGKELGVVKNVLEQPAGDVLEVVGKDAVSTLIPFVSHFVKEVRTGENLIVVTLIEGMEGLG